MKSGLLELYDSQMRRDFPLSPGLVASESGGVVRISGRYNCVVYSSLSELNADGAIIHAIDYYRDTMMPFEWKVHAHDQPQDLAARLSRRGFQADLAETLLACDIHESLANISVNPGVVVRPVSGETGVADFFSVAAAAFRRPFSDTGAHIIDGINSGALSIHVAYVDDTVVAAGRLEMPADRSFAGLYTGGTKPDYRGRGIYRALVRTAQWKPPLVVIATS